MANRMRGSRFGFGRGRRSQARPMAAERRAGPGPRARTWLGWAAAAAGVAVVAFFVGRAGSEVGIASPTASPSAVPLTVTFGTAVDSVSGEAIQPTSRFRAGDQFAYSVQLAAAPGVANILVEIIRLEGGTETVVQVPSKQGIVATSPVIAFAVRATDLLHAWGPGSYAMRMYLPGASAPFATGRFTLVETPVPS
jgi:hypothetical protein